MRIVVDGNDGTGKSTLVKFLKENGYNVQDRGAPTKMTDDPTVQPDANDVYLILDAPVELCRERLQKAGKNLNEKYHTVEDLTYYRNRFLEVAKTLPRCTMIDASGTPEEVVELAIHALNPIKINP
jgi:thymidylate kinase